MSDEPIQLIDDDRDRPWASTLARLEQLTAAGYLVYVKWTCPKCGDRCASDVPNVLTVQGYYHTERDNGEPCGQLYDGGALGMYGLVAVKDLSGQISRAELAALFAQELPK